MATIQKAYPEDFERIYPLIQQFNNPRLGEDDWRALFTPRWKSPWKHVGYYIEENGEAVGFLGLIASTRKIRGKEHLFCNMSTWMVKEDFRGMSLLLLFEMLKLKGCTFTDFTANKVAPILKKFGFRDLTEQLFVQLPLPLPGSMISKFKLNNHKDYMSARLKGEAHALFRDHDDLKCSHLLIKSENRKCYIIYDIVKRKRLPVARIHYISDIDFYIRYAHLFALPACIKAKTFGWMAGNNLLKGYKPRFALTIPQKQSFLFRSETLQPEDIDTLYSELQVLGLRT